MKKALLVLFSFFYLDASSQTSYCLEIGMNGSKMSPLTEHYSDIKFKFAPSGGLNFRSVIKQNTFYYHVGLVYDRLGEQMEIGNSINKYSYNLYIDYIKLPVKLEYKLYNFQCMAGIFVARVINGNIEYSNTYSWMQIFDGEGEYKIKPLSHTNDFMYGDNDYLPVKKWNLGYTLSLGYKLNRFGLIFSYEQGLRYIDYVNVHELYFFAIINKSAFEYRYQPFLDSDQDGRLKTRNFNLSLLYYFGRDHFK